MVASFAKRFTRHPDCSKGKSIVPEFLALVKTKHIRHVMHEAGYECSLFYSWNKGDFSPSLPTLETVLHTMGYQLKIARINPDGSE